MKTATRLATENVRSGQGGPFAAIVVKNGKIIARGTNRVVRANDPTAHAEIDAIREACRTLKSFQLTGCEMYISCEPCPMCLGAIYWARLRRVYFAARSADAATAGFDDARIYQQLALPKNKRRIPVKHVRCADALEPFRLWKSTPNRVPY